MKHRNDPTRNLIMAWRSGPNGYTFFHDIKKAPRWIRNRGQLLSPCDVAGCKDLIGDRAWYVREPGFGVICQDCAKRQFGVEPPTKG